MLLNISIDTCCQVFEALSLNYFTCDISRINLGEPVFNNI